MINRIHISTFFLFLLFAVSACTSSKNINTRLAAAQTKVPGITMEQLNLGKKTYIRSCAGCHALKDPAKYTPAKWEPILKKMFVKAKISDSTKILLITNYVIAKSK